jgi:hypothetical protein
VCATREVLALVSWDEFPTAENLICFCLGLDGEHLIDLAGVDQERSCRFSKVGLEGCVSESINAMEDEMWYLEILGDLQERRVGDDGALDDVVECEVKGVATWGVWLIS